jgi:hypothetical protein
MALNPIAPVLRRFVNDSRDITRVELRVPPGAELEVDEVVAAQLPAAFKDPDDVKARDAARAPKGKGKAKATASTDDAAAADPDAGDSADA